MTIWSLMNTTHDDAIWRALGDPSRREILDLLRQGPMTTGAIADQFAFTRFAVMKHLGILRDAGLVLVERSGRERINHLNPLPIRQIYRRWIRPFEERVSDSALRLKRHVERGEKR